jgi:hypothetical protein
VVVSVNNDGGWTRQPPLYSTSTTKYATCEEADRAAIEVAKAWIDAALEGQRSGRR